MAHKVYKEIISTVHVGLVIDTTEYGLGINWVRGLDPGIRKPMAGSLLQISILCLHLMISLP